MLAFFALLKFENKRDATISGFNFNLKHHGQDDDVIMLAAIFNSFPFKPLQKCQHCQLCV